MNEVAILSKKLLLKLKNRGLVRPSATRVIIDINSEAEWIQLYTSDAVTKQHEAQVVVEAVEIIDMYLGKYGEIKKPTKKAKKTDKDK